MRTTSATFALLLALGACIRQTVPESTTTRIGPAGGTAYSTDGNFWLIVPPQAVAADVDITIQTEVGAREADQATPTYRVGPPTLRFAAAATAVLKAPEAWAGELSLRAAADLPLHGAAYHPAVRGLRALVQSLDCAALECTQHTQCIDGAACVDGRCQYTCASDFDCVSGATCAADTFCPAAGPKCVDHACGASQAWPARPARPTEPALVCTNGAFALFVAARPACDGRACGQSCVRCDPSSPACANPPGTCDALGECIPVADAPVQCADEPAVPDGWRDPPGAGPAFVLSQVGLGPASAGWDIDGVCDALGCVDNALSPLGEVLNDQLRQGLLGGEFLFMLEIAGLDVPFTGDDSSVTLKLYTVRDADDPFFPANNFRTPAGDTTCCEFSVVPGSLDADGVALTRWPARIQSGRIQSVAPGPVDTPLTLGPPAMPRLRLDRAHIAGVLSPDLASLDGVVLGGAWSIRSLLASSNPYCSFAGTICPRTDTHSTLLELALRVAQPDVDLSTPRNGLDRFTYDETRGEIVDCRAACPADCRTLTATTPGLPYTCRGAPALEDGFSTTFVAAGVRGHIVRPR